MKKKGYTYIMTNKNKTILYIGVISNLEKRVYEHKNGIMPGFTKRYKVKYLIYYEIFENITDAIYREKVLKGKTRIKKEFIISKVSPKWSELCEVDSLASPQNDG